MDPGPIPIQSLGASPLGIILQLNLGPRDFLIHSKLFGWIPPFYLIARTLDLKKALVPTVASQIGLEAEVEFSSRDWDLMNKIITVLKPFEKATKLLQNSQGVKTMKKSL